ncbi:hypothetical protein K488DRAFT_78824 [Vararia minispora EC-137]|uniref:Uncharacterized protein n=1 Tax=Vararia minispora EC-137 TaxID=1314806 RepID=A0ACB8QJJ6_9AGAM|nr:hypothetical protein K488DRAFT_78824 [Vararia minispora EC-137]
MASPIRLSPSSPPPGRTFSLDRSTLSEAEGPSESLRYSSRPGRISFARLQLSSFSRWWRTATGEGESETVARNEHLSPMSDRPPIPSALQQSSESNSTSLPTLSMVVLSIALLSEFLTANVSMPFVLFMVEGFGEFTDEADVGFWTGILVATFFLTQFLTSLLWATVADRHGARLVLTVALLGSSLTCALFGTATNIRQAITIRLAQGLFAGAIGVARGCVTAITDSSNEGRAYAILGFCWGFGGAAGAIVGGMFESPALKWPGVFTRVALFVEYPYLLPTLIASSITFIGAFLSLFLGPDGGPRVGSIKLPIEKDDNSGGVQLPPTIPEESSAPPSPPMTPLPKPRGVYGSLRRVTRKLSGYLANRSEPSVPEPVPLPSRRRTSRADGSAYGYTGAIRTASFRARLASGASYRRASVSSMMRQRSSGGRDRPSFAGDGSDLNFAQRLLMANENAVTNIADLWVAAAMNVDSEEVFDSDDEGTQFSDLLERGQGENFDWDAELDRMSTEDFPDTSDTPTRDGRGAVNGGRSLSGSVMRGSPTIARRVSGPSGSGIRRSSYAEGRPNALRRVPSSVPSIFAHPGVRTPQAVVDAHKLLEADDVFVAPSSAAVPEGDEEEKRPSVWSQLPLGIIFQYGLLALHSTTHDMVFLSFLVSKYESGGLNLNAGHFSQLTALMCLFQVAYQFYLYPNIGPPRGRFSHLSMFRLGTVLFIPGYLTVTLYRVFASPGDDGNFVLMTALALSAAVRYCGGTFGYTSVSILLNYMSPPPLVGLANGIGQSVVSLARCFGPILGGYIWSISVENNPNGFYIPFCICAAICAGGFVHSALIR